MKYIYPKFSVKRMRERVYKTLGTSIVFSPISPRYIRSIEKKEFAIMISKAEKHTHCYSPI